MTPQQLAHIADGFDALPSEFRMAWTIEDDNLTTSEITALGKQSLRELADRYEFCILEDRWTIDGPFLRVEGQALTWSGPLAVELVD